MGGGEGSTWQGWRSEAVGGGNHTEVLETKREDERFLEGTGRDGAGHSVQRTKVKIGDTLGTASSRAQPCPNNEQIILIDSFSLSSLQLSQKTMSFPKNKWKSSLWFFNWHLIIGGCGRHYLSFLWWSTDEMDIRQHWGSPSAHKRLKLKRVQLSKKKWGKISNVIYQVILNFPGCILRETPMESRLLPLSCPLCLQAVGTC